MATPAPPCTCYGPPLPDHWENCPAAWWNRECTRVHGDLICPTCDKPWWRHPSIAKEAPTIIEACDGRLLKL